MRPAPLHAFRSALLLPAVLLGLLTAASGQVPNTLLHSLFNPGTSPQPFAQQGYSVAVDGDLAVIGAPYDDTAAKDSGVAKVYHAGTGALLHTLINPTPAENDLFGFAVAVSGTRVVVGRFNADRVQVYDLAGATPTAPAATLLNPSPGAYDFFGCAVSIAGTCVVVGAPGDDTHFLYGGNAHVYDLTSATPAVPVVTLSNPDPAVGDQFGNAVGIAGTRVVVGAFRDDTGTNDAGSAYVYDLAGATPATPVLTLTNPSPAAYDTFGSAVAIAGTHVVVGTPYDDLGARDAGSASVFNVAGATPTVPVATLLAPVPMVDYRLGMAVAIAGTQVVVGMPFERSLAYYAGTAYVYDLAGGSPTVPVVTLPNPTPYNDDFFGHAVAVSGARVVVGAYGDNAGTTDAGIAYVYDLAGRTPAVPAATLHQPSPASGDEFGRTVAISGSRVVVGTPLDNTGEADAGSVYVYDLAGATPTAPVAVLHDPRGAFQNYFGNAVAIAETVVVVGAEGDDLWNANSGAAYVYDLASATPSVPVATLYRPQPVDYDHFGSAVAIAGTRVAVAAQWDEEAANNAGQVHVYDLAGKRPSVSVATLTNPITAPREHFGWSLAASGTRLVVGSVRDDDAISSAGHAYVYDLAGETPAVPVTTLTNPGPATADFFGGSVAMFGTWVVVGACHRNLGSGLPGGVHVFDLASATPTVPFMTLTNPSPATGGEFGCSLAIAGTLVVIGAGQAGQAYVYDLAGATPHLPVATLANRSATADGFGWAVAMEGATVIATAPFEDSNATDRGAAYVFGLSPALQIVPAEIPGCATLSWWPATSSGFVLQYAETLSPTNWANAPSGAANPATVPLTNAARFYRLAQP